MFRAWWRDPADYAWLARALDSYTAVRWLKVVVGMGGVFLAGIAMLASSSDGGPPRGFGLAIDWAIAGFAVYWALRWWLLPWPSRVESLMLFGAADVAITVANLQESNRLYGALGLTLLVITGGYLAVMHNAKVLALHAAWTVFSVVLLTGRMVAGGGDPMIGAVIVLMTAACGVVMMPAMQFCFWVLRQDAVRDPLTTLLNRRGMELHLATMAGSGCRGPMCAIAVDLDRFKAINDRFGHRAGDEVLARTAQRLLAVRGPRMVVARTGGEEFVIFGPVKDRTARAAAEQVRLAVSEPQVVRRDEDALAETISVTASIGVVVFDGPCELPLPYSMLGRADEAMYEAKQLGGNLVVVDEPVGSPVT
ncbi:GGDEF domain-containing protein [Nocardia colli]|uniref:GGDEF domain-containing protein n=1 Tax=Nocardia colli TaxID=2545717 RepID=UPI0035E36DB5